MPTATAAIAEWGISKLAFAIRKSDGTYETPVMHPGAINLNVSNGNSSDNGLDADNGRYYGGAGASTKTGELNVAKFSDWFLENILGQVSEGGGVGEGDAESAEFATLWEVDSDQGGTRYVWYSCTSGDVSKTFATTTRDGTRTYATETATITSVLTELPNGNRRRRWKCEKGSDNYANFFEAVYYPTTTEPPTTTNP